MGWPPVEGDRILHKYLPIDGIVTSSDTITWKNSGNPVYGIESLSYWLANQPHSSDDFDVAPASSFNDAPLRSA